MKEILQEIYRIQKLDDQIKTCRDRLDQIPRDFAGIQERLRLSRSLLDELKQQQNEFLKQKKALEAEVEQTSVNIKKHQNQLLSVKTNKEYSTMLHEIEGEKNNISDREEKILNIMEELDKLAQRETGEKKNFSVVEEKSLSEQKVLEGEKTAVSSRTAELEEAKNKALKGLPADILALYVRIGKARNGIAVVPVKNGACGGCFGNLPTQLLNRIKDMDKMITCENCGRILIWQDAKQQQ